MQNNINQPNEELYGLDDQLYMNTNDPKKISQAKTGTEFVFLPQNPNFIQEFKLFEPLYVPDEDILENSLRREIYKYCYQDTLLNKLIYDSVESSPYHKDIDSKSLGLDILPYYLPQGKDDNTLIFESRFESGNLRRAIQIYEYEYNLILKPDYNTNGNIQWFFFSFANVRKGQEYRFNIINMMKPDSLYNAGMRPLFYSMQQAIQKQIGWYRCGYDICYYQNNIKRKNQGYYYNLTVAFKLNYDYDTVYMAHCHPYTYTQLCNYIRTIEKDQIFNKRFKKKQLCQTIAGNNCDYLEITEFKTEQQNSKRKAVVITSRVHPGESMVSYIVQYMIQFLIGNSLEARILRENFVFYIVPMLNIDGVVNGNYRVSLSGQDLNRQYINPNKVQYPTIYAVKNLLRKLKDEKNLIFFCDMHGHSRKKNVFMYGNSGKDGPVREMIFPLLMRDNCPVFNFKSCCFQIQKEKEGSARINIWRELQLTNCYTIEVSFCGADFGKYDYFHFNLQSYQDIAEQFLQTFIDNYEPDQSKVKQAQEEIDLIIQRNEKEDFYDSSDSNNSFSEKPDEPMEIEILEKSQKKLKKNLQKIISIKKKK